MKTILTVFAVLCKNILLAQVFADSTILVLKGPTVNTQRLVLSKDAKSFDSSCYVDVSFENQQFDTLPLDVVSTGTGMAFGATANMMSKHELPTAIYKPISYSCADSFLGNGISIYCSVFPLEAKNYSVAGRYYYGDLVLSFNKPVSNPQVFVNDLGAFTKFSEKDIQGFTAELVLAEDKIISRYSSNEYITISNNNISNSMAKIDANSCKSCTSFFIEESNVKTIRFKVFIKGNGKGSAWSSVGINSGDLFYLGVKINSSE